ncbi:hypothetical protein ACULMA_04840 [Xanthomonas arboricola pv. corylina]|uniref:hypothetical protein n=1 Tax=Xanthomonas arboricola TaxID=56448 RepID=UPI0040407600
MNKLQLNTLTTIAAPTAPAAVPVDAVKLAESRGFNGAIRYVLGYFNGTGDRGSTAYEEILNACGREQIIRSAVEDGELEFTGLGWYVENYGTEQDRNLLATDPQPAAAVTAAKDDGQGMYYIQDTRSYRGNCPMWWAPSGRGYVTRLDEAGTYTFDEAVAKNRCRETDIPWPCAEIDALARLTVDVQHMRSPAARLAEIRALMRKPAAAGGDA